MKITGVRTVLLTGPCTNDPYLSKLRKLRSAAFIEIETDSGLTGVGETYAGYFCPELVPGIVEFFAPILVGQDPSSIETLWQRMFHCGNFWCRTGLGAIVLTGIDAALWDLKGKALDLPVHTLLGGCKHERLPCYATGGPSNYPFEELAAKVEHYLALGFNACKIGAGGFFEGRGTTLHIEPRRAADFEAEKMDFLRRRFGGEVRFMIDGHMGNNQATWSLDTARAVLKALEPFDLVFFEEPLHYTDLAGYAALRDSVAVPVAGGECLTTRGEWLPFVEAGAFDIGQPDASFVGGLGEFMRIAGLLDSRNLGLATHAWGAGASQMQNVHAAFASDAARIVEVAPDYGPLHSELIGDRMVIEDGLLWPPEAPGLGIVLTDEVKQRYPFQPGSGEYNSVPGKPMGP